jgi:hypothetical protein
MQFLDWRKVDGAVRVIVNVQRTQSSGSFSGKPPGTAIIRNVSFSTLTCES